MENKTRREFIRNTAGFTLACCSLSVLNVLQGCSPPRYISYVRKEQDLIVKKSDFLDDKFVLLNDGHLQAPVFLKKAGIGSYIALLMLCTHKGCDVKPAGSVLICPCHGSEFSQEGQVLKGPADQNLLMLRTTSDTENIYIQYKTI